MVFKRNAQDNESASLELDQPTAEAHLMLPGSTHRERSPEDRMSILWRVFGGTILSIAALAGVTLFNNVTSNMTEMRGELTRTQAELNRANAEIRGELNRIHDGRSDVVKKDDFNSRMTSSWEGIKGLQAQNTTQNALLASLKTDQDSLKERVSKSAGDFDVTRKELAAAIETLRKDQGATNDTLKKDVTSLESYKDRLTAVAVELKALQADTAQVRQQLDRNQAYDQERKAHRDLQHKQFEEVIGKLQAGVQDCREKMARLEGQVGPTMPQVAKEKPAIGK